MYKISILLFICQLLLNISSTYPPNMALRINVVNVDAIKEIYVLMYARCCPSSFARTPLKLGQYIHNITVPICKFWKQILQSFGNIYEYIDKTWNVKFKSLIPLTRENKSDVYRELANPSDKERFRWRCIILTANPK